MYIFLLQKPHGNLKNCTVIFILFKVKNGLKPIVDLMTKQRISLYTNIYRIEYFTPYIILHNKFNVVCVSSINKYFAIPKNRIIFALPFK